MDLTLFKWLAILSPAALVALFEYVRHTPLVLSILPMSTTNWLTTAGALVVSYAYFRVVFTLLERIQATVQQKQQELAVLEERDRIARELHDGICQALFFTNVKLMEAQKHLDEGRADLCSADLTESRDAIHSFHDDVRQTIFNLKTAQGATDDLATALRDYLERFQQETSIEVAMDDRGLDRLRMGSDGIHNLMHIIREALWNVRKHAGATRVEVSFGGEGDEVEVRIRDDGQGFAADAVSQQEHRFGMGIMKERAGLLGAVIEIDAALGRGTEVLVRLPAGGAVS